MNQKDTDQPINITQTYNPRYRKGEFKHLLLSKRNKSQPPISDKQSKQMKSSVTDQTILTTFTQINSYISNLDSLFKARMDVHEEEIISIAHSQIKKIQQESQKIIRKYSMLVKERNISNELLDLRYQIKYYQQRACDMFEENKQLKAQIAKLKQQISGMRIDYRSNYSALKNISKKYLKEQTIRKKLQCGQIKSAMSNSSESNIKISLLSSKNPEERLFLASTATKHKLKGGLQKQVNFFSQSLKQKQQNLLKIKNVKHQERLKTEPVREHLPMI